MLRGLTASICEDSGRLAATARRHRRTQRGVVAALLLIAAAGLQAQTPAAEKPALDGFWDPDTCTPDGECP